MASGAMSGYLFDIQYAPLVRMSNHRKLIVHSSICTGAELVPFVVDLVGDPLTKRIKPG